MNAEGGDGATPHQTPRQPFSFSSTSHCIYFSICYSQYSPMTWTFESVRKALGGKLIGHLYMREMVCKTILYLPEELIEHVCRNAWFISSQEDAWAFTFRGSDIRDAHLIFLSDELLSQSEEQITYTIL